jgi:hypothetical protein
MRVKITLTFCAVIAVFALPMYTANAEILVYILPELTGDYDLKSSTDIPSKRTTHIVYEGPAARLELFSVFINGYGTGTECPDDLIAFYCYDYLWAEIFFNRPECENSCNCIIHRIDCPPHAFEHETSWLACFPPWSEEEAILSPGDSLTIDIEISSAVAWSWCTPGYMTLYGVYIRLDMNESILPVQPTTWGRIKAIYDGLN